MHWIESYFGEQEAITVDDLSGPDEIADKIRQAVRLLRRRAANRGLGDVELRVVMSHDTKHAFLSPMAPLINRLLIDGILVPIMEDPYMYNDIYVMAKDDWEKIT